MRAIDTTGSTSKPLATNKRGAVSSLDFAHLVHAMTQACRTAGLTAPGFRSPPRIVGLGRTIRWCDDGTAIVAVALKRRPIEAVIADMIEGVIAANRLDGVVAARMRDDLWVSLMDEAIAAA